MPTDFTDTSGYLYQPGALFLGLDDDDREIGVLTERHAITIAGAGAGKGAALLIPNARRWTQNLLAVDPKGENAEQSWEAREAMGQHVGVLDPFRTANIPDRLRVSFNPLAAIDPESLTAREDIEVVADGMVKRSDPKHAEWDDGAAALLAGLIAFVIAEAPPEHRNLAAVRNMLLQPDDALYQDAQRMLAAESCGGLAKAAGVTLMTAITAEKSMEKDFLGGARRHSKWVDSPAIGPLLASTTFDLSELKTGAASLYLVLPPQYLNTHAAFLRLFVRCTLNVMAKGGLKGQRCLFLLDEFHSLGKINEIAVAAGLMRGYGVSLWPFLQDLGQLEDLYGNKAAHTFFGNSDAHVFFGNTDAPTLDYISNRLGTVAPSELAAPPAKVAFKPNFWQTTWDNELTGTGKIAKEQWDAEQENFLRSYQHQMTKVGKNRVPPDEIRELVAKKGNNPVSENLIVFAKGRDILLLKLLPYWVEAPIQGTSENTTRTSKPPVQAQSLASLRAPTLWGAGAFVAAFVFGIAIRMDDGTAFYLGILAFFAGFLFRNRKRDKTLHAVHAPRPLGRKWGPLDFASGIVALMLLGTIVGPLSEPATVPRESWSALYVLWTVLAFALIGLRVWRHKTRR